MNEPERSEGGPRAAPSLATENLYAALVGAGWATLPPPVRAIHSPTTVAPARGAITVRRGAGLLARLIGFVLRLPPAGERVAAELRVTPLPHRRGPWQRWSRVFGGVPLVTEQAALDGALLEFAGPFALAFTLHADAAALRFVQGPTRLGRPGFLLPWPRALSPRVTGRCEGAGPATAHVNVEIVAPLAGLLVAYDGTFEIHP